MGYEVIKVNENTWRIEDGGVRFFLLAGTVQEKQAELRGNIIMVYDLGFCAMLCGK